MANVPEGLVCVAVGWDVGSISGNNHGLAMIGLSKNGVQLLDNNPKIESKAGITLPQVVQYITDIDLMFPAMPIILAVDAPLQFPKRFIDVALASPPYVGENPVLELDELYKQTAFRKCEIWVNKTYQKHPLSGSFNWLSNNSVAAQKVCADLRKTKGWIQHPFSSDTPRKKTLHIIEVYPGVFESQALDKSLENLVQKHSNLFEQTQEKVKQYGGKLPKTDHNDAVICAYLGLCFAKQVFGIAVENDNLLPVELAEYHSCHATDGWIVCPSPDIPYNPNRVCLSNP